jgi:hypothetical protein
MPLFYQRRHSTGDPPTGAVVTTGEHPALSGAERRTTALPLTNPARSTAAVPSAAQPTATDEIGQGALTEITRVSPEYARQATAEAGLFPDPSSTPYPPRGSALTPAEATK